MIKNYFKIAWRNIRRNKAFSLINILGLSLGMSSSILIILWVMDEKGIDRFHANDDYLFQVYQRNTHDGIIDASYLTQGLLASELKKVIPEIQNSSSLDPTRTYNIEAGNKINKADGASAGADFFKMFSYPVIAGNPESALTVPGGIAISRKLAEQFFGSPEKAVGSSLKFENKESLMVTAVFENVPANSSVKFDFLRPWVDFLKENPWANTWGSADPATFIQLRKDADPKVIESKIKDFFYRYQQKEKGSTIEYGIQPYGEKYLHANFSDGMPDGGRVAYVRLFSIVAIFILVIACINFMNLATARSTKRAREVGVRKVMGAEKSALISQFVGEAIFLAFLSLIVGLLIVMVSLPTFNGLTGKQLHLPVNNPVFYVAMLALLVITGFVSGSYPAFFMASLNPVRVLKGTLKFSWTSLLLRKGLVVFQFSLSVILMICMVVIYRQVQFAQTKNLGYDRQNLLYVPIEGDLLDKYDVFKQEASQLPGILSISKTRESPTVIGHSKNDIGWEGKDPAEFNSISDAVVGYDYVKTLQLQIAEGRDFSPSFGADSASTIVNESAAKKMGYDNPIGKPVFWGNERKTIIAVVKDFHFNSIHEKIAPLVIRLNEKQKFGTILVRTEAGKTAQAISGLERVARSVNPSIPFTYQFSDEAYGALYKSEQLVSKLTNIFAFLAILISCLGLFGLATFTAQQRFKEIGVRKTLGATSFNIVKLLSGNFLQPVFLSMLIAFPVAWWLGSLWLSDYSYKTGLDWWIFAACGLLTIVIALATVSFQSLRAAGINPVESLRSE